MQRALEFSDFSDWKKWDERNSLPNIKYHGVYAIAISDKGVSGEFACLKDIAYFGMSCTAETGIKNRLYYFNRTIKDRKNGHGGARRFLYEHEDYEKLEPKLFVSIASCGRKLTLCSPENLRMIGEVLKFEYVCFAEYYEKFGKLPAFNNPKAPKFKCT